VVPRLSYASVEEAFLELAAASPVRSAAQSLGRRVTSTLEGLKARRALRGARVWRQRGAQLACRRPSSVAPRRARDGGRLEPVCKACACGLETPAPQGVLRAFRAKTPPGSCHRACGAAGGVEEQRAGADAARAGWQQPARRAAAPRSPSPYPTAVLAGRPSAASNMSPVRTAHLTVLRR